MNEPSTDQLALSSEIQHKLMILVERVVRPILAKRTQQRRMREELLAHLSEIYEDELLKEGEPQHALQNAATRFGSPADVSRELQASVNRRARYGAIIERWSEFEPRTSIRQILRAFLTLAVLMLLAHAASFLAVYSIPFLHKKPFELPVLYRIALVNSVTLSAATVLVLVWANRIARAMEDVDLWQSRLRDLPAVIAQLKALPASAATTLGEITEAWTAQMHRWAQWRIWAWTSAALFLLPALAFLLYWGITGDAHGALTHLKKGCLFAIAGPVILYLLGYHLVNEQRERVRWAQLDIDEPIAGLDATHHGSESYN